MSTELTMLTWTAGLTGMLWLPYIVTRLLVHGIVPSLTYKTDHLPITEWGERAKRAHYNAIENLIPFAALILVAQTVGANNEATAAAAIAFFWARVAHFLAYVTGIPFGRTLTFAVGWLAIICIFYQIVTMAA